MHLQFKNSFFLAISFFLIQHSAHCQYTAFDYIVTTHAGTGTKSLVNGAGNIATFKVVSAIKLDSKGNGYVVDASNNCIRKITPLGVVSTFAGNGTVGTANGTGTGARFSNPYDLAIDANDNIYVTDLSNRCIRKITSSGVVTTYAGVMSSAAYVDGVKGTAKFYGPRHITVDTAGNLYVLDMKMVGGPFGTLDYIRKVSPNGTVSTVLGGDPGYADGVGKAARFNSIAGLQADTTGNLYVVDYGNNKIRKVRLSDTLVSTFAGSEKGNLDGTLTTAQFTGPQSIAWDKLGNFYLADYDNFTIRKITGNSVTTIAGTGVAGYVNEVGLKAQFDKPINIASTSDGTLYICDINNNVIRKVSGQKLSNFATEIGKASPPQAVYVSAVKVDVSILDVEAPAGYELSLTETGTYTTLLHITGSDGNVPTTKIFIRLKASNPVSQYQGDILLKAKSSGTALPISKLPVNGFVTLPTGYDPDSYRETKGVYPNPVSDILTLVGIKENYDYQIFDSKGIIWQFSDSKITEDEVKINVASLPSGQYILKVKQADTEFHYTFIKR